ncbi:MAG: hypothetical protein M3264_14270 [Thermoproteota archaeon]|nr:hypothetical protein [Thermoproteota archaeon]
MWSRFKSAGEHKEAEAAFILIQREEERKGKRPNFYRMVKNRERKTSKQHLKAYLDARLIDFD